MKRILALVATVVILGCLLRAVDWADVSGHLSGLHLGWLTAALALFVVQVVVSAARWQRIARDYRLRLGESIGHILASSALNLAVPAKLGDLSKAAFLTRRSQGKGGRGSRRVGIAHHQQEEMTAGGQCPPYMLSAAAALVILEKVLDVAALGALLLVGLALMAPNTIFVVALAIVSGANIIGVAAIRTRLARSASRKKFAPLGEVAGRCSAPWLTIVAFSLTLWCLHLLQIAFFFYAAGIVVTPTQVLSRVPLAIFAGLLPITIGGIGTRDSALVVLFLDVAPPAAVAVVGLLTALRYLIPGIAGLPVLAVYLVRQGRTSRLSNRRQVLPVPAPHVALASQTRSDSFA